MTRKIYLVWITLFFFSCAPEEQTTRSDENLVQNLSSGVWEISFFIVDGVDRSADFEGVSFVFLQSGQAEALRGTQLLAQGTWSTRTDLGRIEFQLSFDSNPEFGQLSADWYQVSIINDTMMFRKVQSDSEDSLTLTKR